MQKRAPTLGNILVIILFALSCFGLLLFLWESFGGPLPLKPKGYRFTVGFPRTLSLAEQSDVRISGVEVGHVIALKVGRDGRTHATIEIASQYAPIRADMHAILRQKTLLGETYVQLIPQSRTGPFLRDGGRLADSQVEPSVTLDDILSLLTPKTRRDFQIWMQSQAEGLTGRGEQINASLATLEPFVEHGNQLVSILASQEGAVRALVHNTGVVFDALAGRDHQLEGLIVNGERTFHAAAEGSEAFANAFRLLPSFEHNSTVALRELDSFATVATPFLEEFQPAERQLALLLAAAKPFAPEFDTFLTALGPLTKAAKTGLPDVKTTLDLTTPVLENAIPVLHNFDPLLQYAGQYVPELQAFFANITAATQAHGLNGSTEKNGQLQGPQQHYLRGMQVFSPETLAIYPQRVGTDRSNPYFKPGAFRFLGNGGLQVFSGSACANSAPSVSGPPNETISENLIHQIQGRPIEGSTTSFTTPPIANEPETPNKVLAPACNQQGPFSFNGQISQFPHVIYGGK
jgi:phospholipid/cholesterol/gamma-HCH transport system substrate-binding protein